jgi:hypothetical protein
VAPACYSPLLARSPCPGSAVRPLDAAEHLLVRCRPLGQQWGLERFGLADPLVLQAIEVGICSCVCWCGVV